MTDDPKAAPPKSETDAIWSRAEIDSPCIKVCVVEPRTRLCTGCLRTIDEIATWSRLTADARREIMDALPSRAPLLRRRRGGRAARLAGES